MKILIDTNLSPNWVRVLGEAGFEAARWSRVGDPRASDRTIMDYASARGFVVLTHDLDFGAILAATGAERPSVVQSRAANVDPTSLGAAAISLLRRCQKHLERGALVCLDPSTERVRMLPLRGESD